MKVLTKDRVAELIPTQDEALELSRFELQDRLEEIAFSHEALRMILEDFHRGSGRVRFE